MLHRDLLPSDARQAHTPDDVIVLPGSSAIVTAGGFAFTGAIMPFGPDHRLDAAALSVDDAVTTRDPLEVQSEILVDRLRTALAAVGCDGRDVMRVWQWMPAPYPADEEYRRGPVVWPPFHSGDGYVRVAREFFDSHRSSTGIGLRQLPLDTGMMAVEVMAALPRPGVQKLGYPGPGGVRPLPFESTVSHGAWVTTVAGASDFEGDWLSSVHRGEPSLVATEARVNPYIWLGSEIATQTDWTLRRLQGMADRAGSSLERCVHADVTLLHPDDYPDFERVWRTWFPDVAPARRLTTGARIVVKGVRVEIALTLLKTDSSLQVETVTSGDVLPPVGHAATATRAGGLLFVSSRLPLDETHAVPRSIRADGARPYIDRPVAEQTDRVLQDLDRLCLSVGSELSKVCKLQVNMADLAGLPDVLEVFARRFPVNPPALSVLGMGGDQPLLAPGAEVQVDAVVWAPGG